MAEDHSPKRTTSFELACAMQRAYDGEQEPGDALLLAEFISRQFTHTIEQGKEIDHLRAILIRTLALHQPKQITQILPCDLHANPLALLAKDRRSCPDCVEKPVTVCSNSGCCTWPCPTAKALEQPSEPPSLNQGGDRDRLHDAVQLLLINHHHELLKPAGEQDPEIAELAAVYEQLTGWDALEEIRQDRDGHGCVCGHFRAQHAEPDACFGQVDGKPCDCDDFRQEETP